MTLKHRPKPGTLLGPEIWDLQTISFEIPWFLGQNDSKSSFSLSVQPQTDWIFIHASVYIGFPEISRLIVVFFLYANLGIFTKNTPRISQKLSSSKITQLSHTGPGFEGRCHLWFPQLDGKAVFLKQKRINEVKGST